MEDTDSSGTRKRPRLDSGDRAYRSMSADRLGATPTNPGLAEAPTTPQHAQVSSQSSETASGLPSMSLTPSKVTINVREPNTIASPTPPSTQVAGPPSLRGGGGGDIIPTSSNDPSSKLDSSPSNVISVTSSPPRSPEIEVAEIEDMNDESGDTRWRPLISATSLMDAKDIQQSVLEDFPYLGERGRNLRKTIAALAQTFEKGECLNQSQRMYQLTVLKVTSMTVNTFAVYPSGSRYILKQLSHTRLNGGTCIMKSVPSGKIFLPWWKALRNEGTAYPPRVGQRC